MPCKIPRRGLVCCVQVKNQPQDLAGRLCRSLRLLPLSSKYTSKL